MVNLSKFRYSNQQKSYVLEESSFVYEFNNNQGNVKGKYQLDPIPNMLIKENIKIDKAVLFATKEVEEAVNVVDESDDYSEIISPLDYYKKHMNDLFGDLDIAVIPIEDDIIASSIEKAVNYLEKQLENKEDRIDLYIDTHGGFRSTQLVQEAIMQLLLDNRVTSHFYNVYYGGMNAESRIEKDNANNIFEFVSGIKEFDYTGRIDSIEKYLDNSYEGDDKELIDAIKLISDGIQWCNIKDFESGIDSLRKFFQKEHNISDSYLSLLEDHIRFGYGDLMSKNVDAIDMVEWCINKGFYQQALTIIEGKVPDALFENEVFQLTNKGKQFKNKYKVFHNDGLRYSEIFNGCIYNFGLKPFPDTAIQFNNGIINDECVENTMKTIKGKRTGKYFIGKKINYAALIATIQKCSLKDAKPVDNNNKKDIAECELAVKPHKGKSKDVCMLLFIHQYIKNIRNQSNHADAEKGFESKCIRAIMIYYMNLYRRIIRDN